MIKYECNNCGNATRFRELNLMDTYLLNGKQVSEKFVECEDVICEECNARFSEGFISRIESDLSELNTEIMTEITKYCAHECSSNCNCSENECVLYRIERLILEDE